MGERGPSRDLHGVFLDGSPGDGAEGGGGRDPWGHATDPASGAAFGRALFDGLFSGDVRTLLDRSLGMAQAGGRGLRIKLHVDPSDPTLTEVSRLPWELLHAHGTREYLALSEFTPVVRFLDVQRPWEPPSFKAPLRVLVVLANPEGSQGLDLARERALIAESWARLKGVEVEFLDGATRDGLLRALSGTPFHVLHVMGHGTFDPDTGEGMLVLEDGRGGPELQSGRSLGVLLRDLPSLRLVFLNACDTARAGSAGGGDPFAGVASALVLAGVPAVVAMQRPIQDRAAIAFAGGVYAALSRRQPVDVAVGAGRKAVHDTVPGTLEWAIPVLFLRSPDGHLFRPPPVLFTPGRRRALVAGTVAAALLAGVGALLSASRPLALDPSALQLAAGRSAEVRALSNGEAVTPDAWRSSDTTVAMVADGRIRAQSPGTARVTATLGWFSRASSQVTVVPTRVASVQVERGLASLRVGDTLRIPAAALDAEGFVVPGSSLDWTADDASVARITDDGSVVGVAPGRTVLRVSGAEGRPDSVLLSVLGREGAPTGGGADQDRTAEGARGATPSLVRFELSDRSTFVATTLPWGGEEPYYSASARFQVGAPCQGECWTDRCEAVLEDQPTLGALMRFLTGDPQAATRLEDPRSRESASSFLRGQLLGPGMSELRFRLQMSEQDGWADLPPGPDRTRIPEVAAACTPPPTVDALVFSVTLRNPSDRYLSVTEVRYAILTDGGEAGGGAGAGLLEPLTTYLHPIQRTCELPELHPFRLTPILEIAPGRSATFDLQPSLRIPDYPGAFLAPLQFQVEVVTDGGVVTTETFWVEGVSCAG